MDDSSYAGGGGKKSVSRLQQRKEMCKVHLEKDYSSCTVKNVTVGKQKRHRHRLRCLLELGCPTQVLFVNLSNLSMSI